VARREFTVFSLSFLDVMACGLGATILFLMIISAQVRIRAEAANADLVTTAERLRGQVEEAESALARAKARDRSPPVPVATEIERLKQLIADIESRVLKQDQTSLARRESVEELRADLKRLEEANARLAVSTEQPATGSRVRSFVGQGNRQYLTGMKMGGKRVLILVDSSSSMLGRSYANVVRFRAMPDARKRSSSKWRQVVASVDWLSTRVDPNAQFQLYLFNETVVSALPGTEGRWLEVGGADGLDRAVANVRKATPGGGTSLQKAFRAVAALKPAPDNVYLLTDGLPTQGDSAPGEPENVPPNKRLAFFDRAVRELPARVPVNVLLYPMDGDPDAAVRFWDLAVRSRGSLMTPSRDWP
jgi:hypothetical protein